MDASARRLRRSRRAAIVVLVGCLGYVVMVGATVLTEPVEPDTLPAKPQGLPAAVVEPGQGDVPAGLVDPGER